MKPISVAAVLVVCLMVAGCSTGTRDGTAVKAGETSTAGPRPVPTVVVLDASDSMNTADAPGPRIDAARSAVQTLAGSLPSGTRFGVVAFGSQMDARSTKRARGCTDVTTPVPLAPLDGAALTTALNGLHARGFTPIANALRSAADQIPRGSAASIVLVSDGRSTCAPDPCDTARDIHTDRPDLLISAVGFRTDHPSLQCIADAGGGAFVTADNAAQLNARLSAVQNSRDAATRLSTTSRDGIEIGATLADVRSGHADFPSQGRRDGDRTVYVWKDCEYVFDAAGKLIEIAPGSPPGSAGVTIDGVAAGTPGSRAVELYGEPRSDEGGVAVFVADEKAGTGYRIGYGGGSGKVADGTVTTVVLCGCLPGATAGTDESTGDTEVVKLIAVNKRGEAINGFRRHPYLVGSFIGNGWCEVGAGALTKGVYRCGTSNADSWAACWVADKTIVLCSKDPNDPVLSPFSVSQDMIATPAPTQNPGPWKVTLASGAECTVRSGGSWPVPPEGYSWTHSCTKGSVNSFLVRRDDDGLMFDKSGGTWKALETDGTSMPTLTPVKKVVYTAAEQ
ncbi:hypothetical protein nbrc107696_24520 [Gordonia spumicola]|uniref:VWFA domain-containing protein n=1 Tax=Gordonia spumicola TaxID=589161 RepID=A0A7I9V9C7_9ACTN|nr:VWA domain-containing protein [Gordonia spumicola]GEE02006.1 hypothetical protein nbrc107696_24520 [Gordonia spumicola]